MNKRIISIILCLAMLVSGLTISSYAGIYDVEIDLGGLFDDDDDSGNNKTPDDELVGGDDNSSNSGNTGNSGNNSGNSNSGNGSSSTTDKDDSKGSSSSKDYDELLKEMEAKKEQEKKEEQNKEWVNNFTDVKESDWYYDTVKYVSENGIFNGMTETTFVPSSPLTRAMLVTVLYRTAGSPRIESDSKFDDVEITDWFGAAVIWASENGIVNGISETEFAPNNNITREQIATIVYRYAKSKNYDTTQGGMAVREYADYETISSWAKEAMQWSVNTKLITGKTATTVNPLDNATRAEAATIIMRFIEANK